MLDLIYQNSGIKHTQNSNDHNFVFSAITCWDSQVLTNYHLSTICIRNILLCVGSVIRDPNRNHIRQNLIMCTLWIVPLRAAFDKCIEDLSSLSSQENASSAK